jgi:hypothetical protein
VSTMTDVDLNVLVSQDADRSCEIFIRPGKQCGQTAEWLLHATLRCGHHPPQTRLICAGHKDCELSCTQRTCYVPVRITWIEPLR